MCRRKIDLAKTVGKESPQVEGVLNDEFVPHSGRVEWTSGRWIVLFNLFYDFILWQMT